MAILALVLLVPGGALAQLHPIAESTRIERRSEHSCSQSFASTTESVTVALRIDENGGAELELEREVHETSGPSRGRFSEGDRDFSHITEREVHRLSGRASRSGGILTVAFAQDETSRVRYSGPGTLPLPPARSAVSDVVIECRPAVHLVHAETPARAFPAPVTAGEPVRGLTCTFTSGAVPGIAPDEPLRFARAAPLVLYVSDGLMGDPTPRRVLRRAPSP